ncbi:unnamed protein product [Ceutorhynchus assimilis]|uniref:Inositol-pentakisphosphate 2-kinase n=1 Tax=Ceutorhynchus assimilis TaxID=467358 RepID=A0A9P0DN65_9CUCU|nr:unnamed protein product [Ceutorhynchus assimilis]
MSNITSKMTVWNSKNPRPDDQLKEWIYRGEGNCNLVLSLPKSRRILRIRKTEKPKTLLGWILVLISDFIHWYYGIGFKDEVRDLNFYNNVMRPLIGLGYTSESKQVALSRKQMRIFNEGLEKKRPEHRQNKTLQYNRAALFNDFAYLPIQYDYLPFSGQTYSVEIKPKQGWRPLEEQQLYKQCFFCMNQHLKLEKKTILMKTKYCPEELFSGDEKRMKIALKHLIEIPQNNFKIFRNGLLCYDGKNEDLIIVLQEMFESQDSIDSLNEEFCDFLQKCLIKNLANNPISCICSPNTKLPKGSVLEHILSVQMLDTEGTKHTFEKFKKHIEEDDYSFVDKLLEIVESDKKTCVRCIIQKAPNSIFMPYLIAAIAKDCSLMITFRKLNNTTYNGDNVFVTKFGSFLVNIGVFDLYPKPLSTIRKHFKRNADMVKALVDQI